MTSLRALIALAGAVLHGTAGAQVVSASRIDARPAGHPLDSGWSDPIIDEEWRAHWGLDGNSNGGPCVIRVPDWIPEREMTHPSAKYYLYYSGHHGSAVKLAWAARLDGEWRPFNDGRAPGQAWGEDGNYSGAETPGVGVLDRAHHGRLKISPTREYDGKLHFVDVWVDDAEQRIVMYFHGKGNFVATSKYGLNFHMPGQGGEAGHGIRDVAVTEWYLRTFVVEGEAEGKKVTRRFGRGRGAFWSAPQFTRAGEPATNANGDEVGGLWNPDWEGQAADVDRRYWWTQRGGKRGGSGLPDPLDMGKVVRAPELQWYRHDGGVSRHFTFYHNPQRDRDRIYVFYTNARTLPESVVYLVLDLAGLNEEDRLDPGKWRLTFEVERVLLKPQEHWEGIHRAYKPSNNGVGNGHHFRDPYVFEDNDGKLYLFYCGFGEGRIGMAKLTIKPEPTAKSLRVTYPFAAHPCQTGEERMIGWRSSGAIEEMDIEFSRDGRDWTPIASGIANREHYLWTVPDTPTTEAKLRIRESGGATVAESEAFTITEDKFLGFVAPRRGTRWTAGRIHYPTFCRTGDITKVDFHYSLNGKDWIEIARDVPDTTTKRAQWNAPAFGWEIPDIRSDSVRLRVREAGGGVQAISEPFSVVVRKVDSATE